MVEARRDGACRIHIAHFTSSSSLFVFVYSCSMLFSVLELAHLHVTRQDPVVAHSNHRLLKLVFRLSDSPPPFIPSSNMSWFSRKDKTLIPAVQSEDARRQELLGSRGTNSASPRPPSNFSRSSSATYVASRDGDPYSSPTSVPPPPINYGDRYTRKDAVGDVYSRGQGNIDRDRGELLGGYKPQKPGSGRFFDDAPPRAPGRRGTPPPGEENDEDVEGIKQDMRFMKQDSVNSTRNALRLAREAEETARNTVNKLGSQSGAFYDSVSPSPTGVMLNCWLCWRVEKLADTERHLDISKGYSQRAADKTDELKQLNRSIFVPTWTRNKDAKRAAQEQKIQDRYEEERTNREKEMRDVRDTQDRLGRAATYGGRAEDDGEGIGGGSGRYRTAAQLQVRKEQRKRYQFEADEEDDQLEDEIDDNLDEIMDVTKRLKALGTAMSGELDTQNSRIDRITNKTDGLDQHLFTNTQRVSRLHRPLRLPADMSRAAQPNQVDHGQCFCPFDVCGYRCIWIWGTECLYKSSSRLGIILWRCPRLGNVLHLSVAKPTEF